MTSENDDKWEYHRKLIYHQITELHQKIVEQDARQSEKIQRALAFCEKNAESSRKNAQATDNLAKLVSKLDATISEILKPLQKIKQSIYMALGSAIAGYAVHYLGIK